MASNYVTDTAAGKSISAYIVLNKKGVHVATVRASWSNSGNCLVNVHDDKDGFQSAKRGGGGYDKFASALSGMTIDGHVMNDHCGMSLSLPKGKNLFPSGFKVPKGYHLANYWERSRATGKRLNKFDFEDTARKNLGFDNSGAENLDETRYDQFALEREKLFQAWRDSDDCERGYSSCFRESGLKFLEAIGYRVIQAI